MAAKARDLFALLARVTDDNAAKEFYLVDIVNIANADGRHCAVVRTDPADVAGINSRAELAAAEAQWQAFKRDEAMAGGASLKAPETVWFSWDTEVGRDVTIEPNVFFGPGAKVADGVTIRAGHVGAHGVGGDLVAEGAGGDGRGGPMIGLDGESVLGFAADLPFLGHLLGGEAHAVGDGHVLVAGEDGRVEGDLVAHHLGHDGHALGAGGDHHVRLAQADARGGVRHGLQAGGAEAVDGNARHGVGQTGEQHADAGDVHALLRFRHGAADDHVADLAGVQAGHLADHGGQDVGQHVVRPDIAEHAVALGHRGAGGGDDVGFLNLFAHCVSPGTGRRPVDGAPRVVRGRVSCAGACRFPACVRCAAGSFRT